jgi:hypothetical protein
MAHEPTHPLSDEYWIKVEIPIESVAKLGFHPHAAQYEADVLTYFSPESRVRWIGHGITIRPGKPVEEITWEFRVSDVPEAVECLKVMFRERTFPNGTKVTKVTKHPDLSFSFERLIIWHNA